VEAVEPWLRQLDVEGHFYRVCGGPKLVGKRFTVQFEGAAGLAAARVRKALALLRNRDGWTQLSASSPTGRPIQLFPSMDENGTPEIQWDVANANKHGIDRERIKTRFMENRADAGGASAAVWSNG